MQENSRFDEWNKQKKAIDSSEAGPYFDVGEIWWAKLGQNISTEVNGKGKDFLRPVLILQKVYGNALLAIPLTAQERKGDYYFLFIDSQRVRQYALLPQIRYLDGKRLKYKKSKITRKALSALIECFIGLIKK